MAAKKHKDNSTELAELVDISNRTLEFYEDAIEAERIRADSLKVENRRLEKLLAETTRFAHDLLLRRPIN